MCIHLIPTSLKCSTPNPHTRACLLENRISLYPDSWPLSPSLWVPSAPCVGRERPLSRHRPHPGTHVKWLSNRDTGSALLATRSLKRTMLCPNKEPSTHKCSKLFHPLEAAHLWGPAREKHQAMKNRHLRVLPTPPPLQPRCPVLPATSPWKPEQSPKHPRIPTHSGTLLEMGGGQQRLFSQMKEPGESLIASSPGA